MLRSKLVRLVVAFSVCIGFLSGSLEAQVRGDIVAGKLGRTADEFMQRCEAFGFSGVVLAQKGSKPILRKGYGEARPGVPNTPETLYDLASASKQVTATAVLYLESKGKLKLKDSISKHLPDVPKVHEDVTIYHLLTHTSGFPRAGASGQGADRGVAVAAYLSAQRTSKAGTRFEYYNGGYALLAAIVEEITGEVFEDWMASTLFAKAKLLQTDFIETVRVDESLVAMDPAGVELATDYIKGWGYRGMGGVLTSVGDVALWVRALNSGKLIPKRSLKTMFKPNLSGYACGWYSVRDVEGRERHEHGGDTVKFGSYIRHYPKSDRLLVVLTNDRRLKQFVVDGLTQIAFGEASKESGPPKLHNLKAAGQARFVGRWTGKGGAFEIEPNGSSLQLSAVSGGMVGLLKPLQAGDEARPLKVTDDPIKAQSDMAVRIIEQLRTGKSDLLVELRGDNIPSNWGDTVLNYSWAEHLTKYGDVLACRACGASRYEGTDSVRTWVELDHEETKTYAEFRFKGAAVTWLDFVERPLRNRVRVAATAKNRLEAVDLGSRLSFKLTLNKQGDTLSMLVRGHKHEFHR